MSFYEVKVVERDGTVLAEFVGGDGNEDASVLEVSRVLNEPGLARIRVPVHHPNAPDLIALKREIQVFRDGELIHWGPLVQRSYADGASEWSSPGVLWYLTRRIFGPISINHLSNPNFTTDMSDWDDGGAGASQSTAVRIRGPGTLRLESGSSGDFYRTQTVLVSTGSIGLFLTAAAWYWIDPSEEFVAPAEADRGLYIAAEHSAEEDGQAFAPIPYSSPVGQWVRLETGIHLLPDLVDEPVEVRLYSPWGVIHWGATSLTELESVSSEPEGTDVTEMMRRIVDYAQNGAGKSDVLIFADAQDPAGITETTAYQFADMANIFATLQTYPARGLADFAMVLDPDDPNPRQFVTHAPTKGSLISDHPLVVTGADVLTMRHGLDGQQTATRVIRRGQGDGSDREVGVAVDTSNLDGLVLEDVADAPPEMSIDGLDQLAATDLDRLDDIVALPDVTVAAEGWWGVVDVGDRVPVTIDWGEVQETDDRRIVAMTLHPDTDTVTLSLQPVPS